MQHGAQCHFFRGKMFCNLPLSFSYNTVLSQYSLISSFFLREQARLGGVCVVSLYHFFYFFRSLLYENKATHPLMLLNEKWAWCLTCHFHWRQYGLSWIQIIIIIISYCICFQGSVCSESVFFLFRANDGSLCRKP